MKAISWWRGLARSMEYPMEYQSALAQQKVIVLVVDPHESMLGHGAEPGADAATWLVGRHREHRRGV